MRKVLATVVISLFGLFTLVAAPVASAGPALGAFDAHQTQTATGDEPSDGVFQFTLTSCGKDCVILDAVSGTLSVDFHPVSNGWVGDYFTTQRFTCKGVQENVKARWEAEPDFSKFWLYFDTKICDGTETLKNETYVKI